MAHRPARPGVGGVSVRASSQPRREWRAARRKVNTERECRVCHAGLSDAWIEAAHVIGRQYDRPRDEEAAGAERVLYVHPDDVVPLCTSCHGLYDSHRLDLLPFLTLTEQARAVSHVGIVRALTRTTGKRQ